MLCFCFFHICVLCCASTEQSTEYSSMCDKDHQLMSGPWPERIKRRAETHRTQTLSLLRDQKRAWRYDLPLIRD